MKETKLYGQSKNIVADNIDKLKAIFPEVFCEDKIDFEKLQAVLGEYIDTNNESYNFTWNGKSKALRLAQTPSTGTLRPAKEESKNWDTTQNLYIEGDNLEVLKLLQKTYHGKVKMIYIDPPYNTGNDFVYPDNYRDNLKNYLEITGQVDLEGNKKGTNSEASGRYHTDWLNMLYPRLKSARNLLSTDGIIFISIDDNEASNLKKICDEVFGEENFAANIIWEKVYSPRMDAKGFSNSHDYILCYVKRDILSIKRENFIQNEKQFNLIDNKTGGKYRKRSIRKEGSNSLRTDAPNSFFPLYAPDGTELYPIKPDGTEGCWRWSRVTYEENLKAELVEWVKTEAGWQVYAKQFLNEESTKPPETLWLHSQVNHNHGAAEELKSILQAKVFDSPKPKELICKMIGFATNDNDIILDFFSGSASTAHAVMQYNVEENSKRKFIMVQLPEPTNEKSEAFKAGYKNICEIGKERIRRAGARILEANKDKIGIGKLDIGFKVYKLDSSNIKRWNPDYENIELTLDDMVNNFVPGRTEEDVVYEIMLKYGIDLTFPVQEYDIKGKKVFSIGFGALLVCLDNDITLEVVDGIVELKKELNPEITRVVFKDNGFKDDTVKTNALQILKRNEIEEFMSI